MGTSGPSDTTSDGSPTIDVEKPCNLAAVPHLLDDIMSTSDALMTGDMDVRQELLIKLRTLTSAIETPRETVMRHCWTMTSSIGALAFGVDTGLWSAMTKNGNLPQRVDELATQIGVDAVLLGRMMRHLAAMGHIIETGPDEYQPTVFAKSLSIPMMGNGLIGLTCTTGAASLKFHEYSRKRGWQNPTDAKDTALMHAYNTTHDMFSWIQSQGYDTHFNDHMTGYHPSPWMSTGRYPIEEQLIDGADKSPTAPFWVDIGGCLGRDLRDLQSHYPDIPGQLILQDLPSVICQVKKTQPPFLAMEHNFFTKQPIEGSRAYYMHSILHDWPDDVCQKILAHITSAMKPGYSKLLIHEQIIPTTNASWETTARDIMMMTMFCAQERSEADWRGLLEGKAGLKVSKIWNLDLPDEYLIECELLRAK
ncbi:sterigmatocystin 8-o-methyltransferase [Fusarium sporotrichioides]|uniref:Sterigmatocystin 8-o-methyltransferase n=1 Tax=Fusarium sporotrichioides TaxID=5514 RepID=A0A395RTN4_FUSSP|nr:sterigmatocystin 8-o-methyltransferase [Fusarium sporotrichioides]